VKVAQLCVERSIYCERLSKSVLLHSLQQYDMRMDNKIEEWNDVECEGGERGLDDDGSEASIFSTTAALLSALLIGR